MDISYSKRLLVKNTEAPMEYDLESKLRNVCIKIPLSKVIRDIPIYTKIFKDPCIRKSGRKRSKNKNIKVISPMSEMISGLPPKYDDQGNPVVTIEINGTFLPNTLVYLGVIINAMIVDTMILLQLKEVRPTPIVLGWHISPLLNLWGSQKTWW